MLSLFFKTKIIDFKLVAPFAKSVMLAGTFNNWSDTSLKMNKDDKGVWRAKLKLKPGSYEYKFVIDGNWMTDPENMFTSVSSSGIVNSIVEVK
jgi:1,4-alpha-glucan branching enzyme